MPTLTGQAAILAEMRTAIAAMETTRDANVAFLEHVTNEPFEQAPAGREAFYIRSHPANITNAFGRVDSIEREWVVDVLLGHAPFGTEAVREAFVARDIERIKDVLCISHVWTSSGVQDVSAKDAQETNRGDPLWWVTTIPLRVIFSETIAT